MNPHSALRDALRRRAAALGLALGLACVAGSAVAHDSWFQRLSSKPNATVLALGTGNLFPHIEFGIDPRYFNARGCRDEQNQPRELMALRSTPTLLWLRTAGDVSVCWMQLAPFEVKLPDYKIDLYFAEVNPTPAVRAAWQALQARGLPWKERYTKHARVALPTAAGGIGVAAAQPAPLGLDLLLEASTGALHVQVLRDGLPLPGFAVELRSVDISTLGGGIWQRTDAQGRAQFERPGAGRWLLRGIDLRLSTEQPDSWDSRFITHSFELH